MTDISFDYNLLRIAGFGGTNKIDLFMSNSINNFPSEIDGNFIYKTIHDFLLCDVEIHGSTVYYNRFLLGIDPLEILRQIKSDYSEQDIVDVLNKAFKVQKTFAEIFVNNILNVFSLGYYDKVKKSKIDYTKSFKIDLMDFEQLEAFKKATILYMMIYFNSLKKQDEFDEEVFKMIEKELGFLDRDFDED